MNTASDTREPPANPAGAALRGTVDDSAAFVAALERMHVAGGDANRMLLQRSSAPERWVSVTARATHPRWAVDASPAWDRDVMRGLGWTQPAADRAWRRIVPGRGRDAAAGAAALVEAVFAADGNGETTWALRLGAAPRVDSDALVTEMREVASSRENQTLRRQRLYHALAASEFLVPLRTATGADPRGSTSRWRHAGTLAGRPVHAVFTDWASACVWDPRGPELVAMRGVDLFAAAARSEAASLLINPGGRVGGELYRHELETIAAGIERMRSRA